MLYEFLVFRIDAVMFCLFVRPTLRYDRHSATISMRLFLLLLFLFQYFPAAVSVSGSSVYSSVQYVAIVNMSGVIVMSPAVSASRHSFVFQPASIRGHSNPRRAALQHKLYGFLGLRSESYSFIVVRLQGQQTDTFRCLLNTGMGVLRFMGP